MCNVTDFNAHTGQLQEYSVRVNGYESKRSEILDFDQCSDDKS